jgi:hypothetical protein
MWKNCKECNKLLLKETTVCNKCFTIDPFGQVERLHKERRAFYAVLFTIGLLSLFYCVDKFELLNYVG